MLEQNVFVYSPVLSLKSFVGFFPAADWKHFIMKNQMIVAPNTVHLFRYVILSRQGSFIEAFFVI